MCTCGIAIATQQAMPAIASSPCSVFGLSPSVPRTCVTTPGAACSTGVGRRIIRISGIIVTMQKMPMPICVARQPSLTMKCCTIGGQTAPER